VLDGLRRAGIPALVNDGVVIPSGTRHPGIALLGVDDVMATRSFPDRRPDLARAIRAVPPDAPRIVLAHNPSLFSLFTRFAGRVALQLSGHTHGGQINPGSIARLVLPYVSGRYEREGSTLYVSNGIGLTGPPVRLFAPPELVRIGLTGRRRG
jgi:predicted MPP superfamily phosphohydrolase